MSLSLEIQNLNSQFATQLPQEVLNGFGSAVQRMAEEGVGNNALKNGDKVPNFELRSTEGKTINFYDSLADGPIILSFQRGGWCPYCSLELRALNCALSDVKGLGARIIALTPEIEKIADETKSKNRIEFDVLIDERCAVAKQFGLTFELYPELRPVYAQLGVDLKIVNGDTSYTLPVPATYIVDVRGKVRYAHVNSNYMVRSEPNEIVKILKELQD